MKPDTPSRERAMGEVMVLVFQIHGMGRSGVGYHEVRAGTGPVAPKEKGTPHCHKRVALITDGYQEVRGVTVSCAGQRGPPPIPCMSCLSHRCSVSLLSKSPPSLSLSHLQQPHPVHRHHPLEEEKKKNNQIACQQRSIEMAQDLHEAFERTMVHCLNAADDKPLRNAIGPEERENDGLHLESDCDAQLLIHITFSQVVKVQSLYIQCAEVVRDRAPTKVAVYVNKPNIDFSSSEKAVQVDVVHACVRRCM